MRGQRKGKAPAAPAPTTRKGGSRGAQVPALLDLQGLAGNKAVAGAVAQRAATDAVQRKETAAVWHAPEDFGDIGDRGSARVVLGELVKTVNEYSTIGIGDVAAQARTLSRTLEGHRARLAGDGSLTTADASSLEPVTLLYRGFKNNAHAAMKSAVTKGLSGLFNPPDLEEHNAAVREAMHQLFLKPDEDKLKAIAEVAESVKGMAESAKGVADKAKEVAAWFEAVDEFIALHKLGEKLDTLKEPFEKALSIKAQAQNLVTIAKNAGGEGGVSGAADALEAGVDLAGTITGKVKIGGVGLFEAVPFFSTYWNDYVKPMTKKCLDMLRALDARNQQWNREQLDHLINWVPTPGGWRPVGPPPELPATMYVAMGISRPMFEYLYLTRQGSQPPMADEVRKNLMGKRKALEALTGNAIELKGATWNPLSWFTDEAKDLPGWVASNISTVWAAYLGSAGR